MDFLLGKLSFRHFRFLYLLEPIPKLLNSPVTKSLNTEVMSPTTSSVALVSTRAFSLCTLYTKRLLCFRQAFVSFSITFASVVACSDTSVFVDSDEVSLVSLVSIYSWFHCELTLSASSAWLSCSISFYARRLMLRFWMSFMPFRIGFILSSKFLRRFVRCFSFLYL